MPDGTQVKWGSLELSRWALRHAPGLSKSAYDAFIWLGQCINSGNDQPSKRELGEHMRRSPNIVTEALRELRCAGLCAAEVIPGSRSRYTLLRGPWEKVVENDPQVPVTPVDKIVPLDRPPPATGAGTPPSHGEPIKQAKQELSEPERPAAALGVLPTEEEEIRAARAELSAALGAPALAVTPAIPETLPSLAVGRVVPGKVPDRPPPRPSAPRGISKASGATLTQPTLLALLTLHGTAKVQALERTFCGSRWRAPGVAEAACRLLLRRRAVRSPKDYVESLYPEALAHAAACAEDLELERSPPGDPLCPLSLTIAST